ncbi:MAG: hypothetical protein QOE46_1078 [Acidobacteriota bacterium]|jgi:hypothetical protein|nr:hypothetical protein [Acidobacteriota bacterium]
MREAKIKGHSERGAYGGVRGRAARLKAFALPLLLACCCVLLTACPPEGGDLVPLPPVEGASLSTSTFEGDTLGVRRSGLTLSAHGRWSVADAATSVILEAANANKEAATIYFGRSEIVLGGSGAGRLVLRSVSRETGAGAPAFINDKKASIEGGEAAKFVLEFKVDSEDGRSGVPRDVTGQTATLRIPVELGQGATTMADFVFGFKYAERHPSKQ